jgi:lipid II:glycine glycyltransferase (peptidoglycan interpeptide bridge formation enzyme)
MARRRNVLRLHLELWTEDHDELEALRAACAAHGMVESRPRSYTHTILVDLTVGEEDLLAGFHATCRRHIRAPEKKGYEVRRIMDVTLAPQIERMFRDAFDRTGGNAPRLDLPELIRQAAAEPSDVHLVGLFASDDVSSRHPLAFATAILHGDVAEYAHAGSTRDPNVKVPLLYAPTRDLMRWARARGAQQWDFGGVAGSDSGDAREGIDNFKFLFSNRVARVGSEWVLECSRLPSPVRPTR